MNITKLTIVVVIVLAVTVTAKYACGGVSWFGLKGSGHVVKMKREVGPFNSLQVSGVFHVYLAQGAKEKVEVETDDNLQDQVITEYNDNKLTVKSKKGTYIRKASKMDIYITVKNINRLDVDGVGDVDCINSLNIDDLVLNKNGVGDMTLQLNGKKLHASINSVGNLTLKGQVDDAYIKNAGVGNLKAFNFLTQTLSIKNNGVGNANVFAEKEINIESTGVGNVRYTGNAAVKEIKTSGVGIVRHEND